MAYPPTVPSGARINTTPQVDTHPADHLAIHAALTDIVTVLGSDPAGDAADVTARFALEMPVGVILPYGGSSAPSGWTLCDGTAVSRATYATLFGVIGTSFNTGGEAGTDFRLPNLQNRYPIGDSGTLTLGATVGSNDAVAVTHNHTQDVHGHSNTFSASSSQGTHAHVEGPETGAGWLYSGAYNGVRFDVFTGSGLSGARSTYGYTQPSTSAASAGGITTTISGAVSTNTATNQAAGVSGTNANRPESVVVNYIIRLT